MKRFVGKCVPLPRLSQVPEHFVHFVCINGGVIPADTITGFDEVATDLPVSHASDELLPRGFDACLSVCHTCLSGVVQKLIVADPEGSVPGFPVCPTLESRCGHVVCVTEVTIGWIGGVWGRWWTVGESSTEDVNEATELSPPQVRYHLPEL